MISLLIDTSSVNLMISIVKENTVLFFSKIEDLKNISVKILEEIKKAIEKCHIELDDIDTIFVVNGPGSFTGIRVGVTVAKTIAYTLHKKVIPISSLALMASTPCKSDYIIPYIDARRGYVYAGMYDKDLNNIIEDSYIKVEELLKKVEGKNVTFTGYSKVDKIENYIKPEENITFIVTKYKDNDGVHPHMLNPNYLKKTEAEEKQSG